MTQIGNFTSTNQNDMLAELRGDIRTLGFSGNLSIVRERQSSNAKAPTHRVYVLKDDGTQFEIGAAWSQEIKRGNRAGEEFLSANLDDPSFERPLSFAIFQDGENTWQATWRRRQAAS